MSLEAQREEETIALSVLNLSARLGWVIMPQLNYFTPQERELVPFVQETGWMGGLCEGMRKISSYLPGFEPQTIQSTVSSYTN
jgi:hypothetical protein